MRPLLDRALRALTMVAFVAACTPDTGVLAPATSRTPGEADRASSEFSEWSTPVNLGSLVNSPSNDFAPEISKDGLSLYFASNRPGGVGLNDIYVSHRAAPDAAWGAPANLGSVINSTDNEAGVNISRDGHWLYFTSTRPGFGGNDLYASWRSDVHDDFAWEEPVNLGMPLNSTISDLGPSGWGPEMYFWRAPAGSNTPGDIFVSRMTGHDFGEPTPVDALNSLVHEEKPSIRFDGREIFFTSNRDGTLDLWVSTRSGNGQEWSPPVKLPEPVNTGAQDRRGALSGDGTALYFDSNRAGSLGQSDLYVTTRTRQSQP